jgi:glycine betaine/proline transport system permease protein
MSENNASSASPWGSAELTPQSSPSGEPGSQTGNNTQPAEGTENAWGAANSAGSGQMSNEGSDWLNQASDMSQNVHKDISFADPFAQELIPFGGWVESGLEWLVTNFRDFFQLIRVPVDVILGSMESCLMTFPPVIVVALFYPFESLVLLALGNSQW